MNTSLTRRTFVAKSVLGAAGAAMAAGMIVKPVAVQGQESGAPVLKVAPESKGSVPKGKICNLEVSRMLLGGNLLTHFTHSRDLKYVYALTRHYNTQQKIMETMATAEAYGINTLVIHTAPGAIDTIKKYRRECGGKIQCIVCPTANIAPDMKAYSEQVKQLVDDGIEMIYLWGVRSDALVREGKMDLVTKAVECAKDLGVPSGVGAHDLNVVKECEKAKIPCDFYIKTFHHHKYPTAPKVEQVKGVVAEIPGYWCSNPEETIECMKTVEKPWMAFKVMAAGAIPPKDAFPYVLENGADHVLVGMFDFEIEEDAKIFKDAMASVKRVRPWRS